MSTKYKFYFDIKDNKGLVVTEANFNEGNMWIHFYPHKDFVKLLQNTVDVLRDRKDKSIWIEGAYGTGKSHAALTLRRLLDCDKADFEQYFDKFKSQLSPDLRQQFLGIKDKNILTCFRASLFDTQTEEDFVACIQESITKELKAKGLTVPFGSLKENAIAWLSESKNKEYFNGLIAADKKSRLNDLLDTPNVDGILGRLNNNIKVEEILKKCHSLAKEHRIAIFRPSLEDLNSWIKEVVSVNKIYAIMLFWDEFTEFFKNSKITGFQKIVEFCTDPNSPFYFIPVTHQNADVLLEEGTKDERKKIRDRFLDPTIRIELSENIAIELIGSALTKNPNNEAEWKKNVETPLYDRAMDSRKKISKAIGIGEDKLKSVLPIHPYAALVLRYLSTSFKSNQRSMFNFLTAGENEFGFKHFISKFGQKDTEPFLTVPFLWDFFYKINGEHLSREIKNVLSAYNKAERNKLDPKYDQVFKAILLLIATSKGESDKLEILRPTIENLGLIFDGTYISANEAAGYAEQLSQLNLIKINKDVYSIAQDFVDSAEINRIKKRLRSDTSTADLVSEAGFNDINNFLDFKEAHRKRFCVKFVHSPLDVTRKINDLFASDKGKDLIHVFLCVAKNADEYRKFKDIIAEKVKSIKDSGYDVVFANAGESCIVDSDYEEYIDYKAHEEFLKQGNPGESKDNGRKAKEILAKWQKKIEQGYFELTQATSDTILKVADKVTGKVEVVQELLSLNKQLYPSSIESLFVDVPITVWPKSNLKAATTLGIEGRNAKLTGAVGSSKDKIITPVNEIFDTENFWERSELPVSRIKIKLDEFISAQLDKKRVVSINEIYAYLKKKPYGFLDTAMSGFLMGFLLKNYANGGSFHYKHKTGDTPLEPGMLISAIVSVVTQSDNGPSPKDEVYEITRQSLEANAFSQASIEIFGLHDKSTFISKVIDNIRAKVQTRSFPLFFLKESMVADASLKEKELLCKVIELYCGVLNSQNVNDGEDNEYKLASQLGELFIDNQGIIETLKKIVGDDAQEKNGVKIIVDGYKDGKLATLAGELGINYLSQLSEKFTKAGSSGNWNWDKETALEQIDKLILEFEIICESKKYNVFASNESELVIAWDKRLEEIRISHSAVSAILQCKELLNQIVDMIAQRNISQLEKLLCLFKTQGIELSDFLRNQSKFFARIMSEYLDGLDAPQIEELFSDIAPNQFGVDKDSYFSYCNRKIQEYKNNLASQKLKDLFKKNTGFSSPSEWSAKKKTPILIFSPKSERGLAKKAFDAINSNNSSDWEVEEAMDYLQAIAWWKDLSDDTLLDDRFKTELLGRYNRIIKVEEAREYLLKVVSEPYLWSELAQVRDEIESLAIRNYKNAGVKQAIEKICGIKDYATLQTYLKKLVEGNMEVGVSIINEE